QYLNLTAKNPENCFTSDMDLKPYGWGLGSFGLPGDFSPSSRFVKASYLSLNSICEKDEASSVTQFFHLLDSVSMVKGSVIADKDVYELTIYSCCVNADKGIYYYKTYTNNQLTAIHMNHENLNGCNLKRFPLRTSQQIAWMN
ncbi:MAG: linear amide C-N hydrolase, partial [Lachnospiraceae bacterium]|nr:linear amide C-N hydrolase [Lachnospiraceae bacterium]